MSDPLPGCRESVIVSYRNKHLFTGTERNSSVFCGSETAVVTRGEVGHKTHCFPE